MFYSQEKIDIKQLILSIFILSNIGIVYAQDNIERATKEVDRPFYKEIEQKLRTAPRTKPLPETKKEEKKPDEKKFLVTQINLRGCKAFSPEEFKSIIEKYENKETTLSELNIAAKKVEREYLRKGIIAACFVPPQNIQNGIVIFQVIEAKMGKLEIQPHKYFNKNRIYYYWQVLPGETMDYSKISLSLQNINKNPDREAKATLKAGKEPETTDVLLNVHTKIPIHLTGSFDNDGSQSSGKYRRGYGLRHNNLLGLDDTLIAGYTFGSQFNGSYAYHSIPVSNFGTSFNYGYSDSKSRPKGEFTAFHINSRSRNFTFSLSQDIVKKAEYIGEVHLGMDVKNKTIDMITGTTNKDRLRILRVGGNFIMKGVNNITYISPEINQGLDILGTRKKDKLTSRGADNVFSKINLDIQHRRNLPFNLQTNLIIKSQYASTTLTPQETFSLGGIKSIRGYASGDYAADSGALGNLELLIPAFFIPEKIKLPYAADSVKNTTSFLAFFDWGWGMRRNPSETERETRYLSSVGAGIRLKLFNQALIKMDWGFPISDEPLVDEAKSRFHLSVDIEDQLPDEIERIKAEREENHINDWAWNVLDKTMKQSNNPLKKKLDLALFEAQTAYHNNDIEKAKQYYETIDQSSQSLYDQTERYIKECIEHRKKLNEYHQLALRYYQEGDYEKAKEIWKKVVKDSKMKSLTLEL